MMLSEVRKRAWETRRAKYGQCGHTGAYRRPCMTCDRMLALIIKLHSEAILSEGQVAAATGLHRIDIRRMVDEL